jgi:hypothetical protein
MWTCIDLQDCMVSCPGRLRLCSLLLARCSKLYTGPARTHPEKIPSVVRARCFGPGQAPAPAPAAPAPAPAPAPVMTLPNRSGPDPKPVTAPIPVFHAFTNTFPYTLVLFPARLHAHAHAHARTWPPQTATGQQPGSLCASAVVDV